ncbi:MAG: helix-turn-helix domain-containing protein [Erysipelotrichaceae bacterium]|nr:helix-turn-helix domain-containing protein [Erysipelotrichaceae bacterium]
MNYLPNKLLKLRKHYGYSQSKVASICGVDTLKYMNYENGNDIPNYPVIKRIASLYHVPVEEIFRNDDKITLHKATGNTTDDLNIAYFTKKSIFRDIQNFIKRNKLVTGIIASLLVIIIVLVIVLNKNNTPLEIVRENINRLSSSSTNVVYIDDSGAVIGTGDNSNGQISLLPSSGAMKVCEGEGFTIILKEDGTVSSIGLLSKYADEVEGWSNITDIACGDSHILALDKSGRVFSTGDNTNKQCELAGTRNIKKIYAFDNGSIVINQDGGIMYSGSFIGSSSLKNYDDILDIDGSDNVLTILNTDKTIDVYTKNTENYLNAEGWNSIVDVACGNDFVAALDEYGKVHIDIENEKYKEEVSSWNNIICIAASEDYLVGYDGRKIYGVGKNKYKQFETEEIKTQILPQVSNVKISKDENYLYVSFDGVKNATGYSVSIDLGTGLNKTIEEVETVKFEVTNMQEDTSYKISIVALGNDDYLDSTPYETNYLFKTETDDSKKDDDKKDDKDEEIITIGEIQKLPKAQFDSYLAYLGIPEKNISSSEIADDPMCDGSNDYVVEIAGISKDEKVTRSEISKRKVKYKYCKIVESEPDEQDMED